MIIVRGQSVRMCNHYQGHPEAIQTWAEYIGWSLPTEPFSDIQIDIWPKREALVARIGADGAKLIEPMVWGVPLTMPGKRPGTKLTKHITNVRNLNSPFWRSMLAKPEQRCLVPFSRFAEPVIGGGKAEHWFTIKDRPVAAFAGVWRYVSVPFVSSPVETPDQAALPLDDARGERIKEGELSKPQKVFAFLTCEPNPLVAPLHPKAMPVVLDESDYDGWLTGTGEEACALAVPFASQLMGVE